MELRETKVAVYGKGGIGKSTTSKTDKTVPIINPKIYSGILPFFPCRILSPPNKFDAAVPLINPSIIHPMHRVSKVE